MRRQSTLLLLTFALAYGGCEPADAAPSDQADDEAAVGLKDARIDAPTEGDAARSPGDAAKADGGARAPMDAAAGDPNIKVGEFSLQLVKRADSYTQLIGKVSDLPAPSIYIWEKQDEANGCVLSTPRAPFCDTSCGTAVCVADDVCQKSPTGVYVGAVTVRGVKTSTGMSEFTLEPINSGNSYQPIGFSLPYPAFEEGDAVEITAAGGEVGPFTLKGKGIAPLELAGSDEGYPLERGKGLELMWTAPTSGGSRVQVKLDISHHGGVKGMVECDVPDNGALSIPAKLTDALLDLGVAGFPTVMVTRSSIGSATTRLGRVDLKIYMYVEAEILIPGLVSCSSADAECPAGKRCNTEKKLCE